MIRNLAASLFSSPNRLVIGGLVILIGVVAGLLVYGDVYGHPDHPDPADVGIEVSSIPSDRPGGLTYVGDEVTIKGYEFTVDLTVTVFGVRGLTEGECPDNFDSSNPDYFAVLGPDDEPIVSVSSDPGVASFTHTFFVVGDLFSPAGPWGFCGLGGDGTKAGPGVITIGYAPYLEGSDNGYVYVGETLVFTGGNFNPNSGVTLFAIDGADGEVGMCEDYDVSSLVNRRGRTNFLGELLPVSVKLDDDPFVGSLQWYFCAYDDHGEYTAPYHVHVKRILRSNRQGSDGYYRLEYGDPDDADFVANEVQIVPGLPSGVSIDSVEIGTLSISNPTLDTDADGLVSSFSINVGVGPDDPDRVREGVYEMKVVTDEESIGDDGVIFGDFDVGMRSSDYFLWIDDAGYEFGRVFEAYPDQTISVSGFGFARLQSGLIFVVENTSDEGCPEYSPSRHVMKLSGVADAESYFDGGDFEFSQDIFDEVGSKWYLCGVDGMGQNMVPGEDDVVANMGHAEVEIVHTLRSVGPDGEVYPGSRGNVLVIGEENTVRIVPPLRSGHVGVDWNLGLQGKGAGDVPFVGNDTTVVTEVLAGLYTMTAFISYGGVEYEVDTVFEVVRPGSVQGDYTLTLDDGSLVHPDGLLLVSGSGFAEDQTVVIYAVPSLGSFCPLYDRLSHVSVSELADSSGVLSGVEFPLDEDAFATEWDWRLCATDGFGNVSYPPLTVRMNRALLFDGYGNELLNGRDNVIRISPVLPSGSVIRRVSLGPFELGSSLPLTSDTLASSFTVMPDVELGIYTLVVLVQVSGSSVETLKALVEVVEGDELVADFYVVADSGRARPGDTLVFSGAGFTPVQTAVVYGFPSSESELCPDYSPFDHDLSFRVVADSEGLLPDTEFVLSDVRFSTEFSWHFCAVGGDGSVTPRAFELSIGRVLRSEGNILIRGFDNEVSISPALPSANLVTGWSLGSQRVDSGSNLVRSSEETIFIVVPNMEPGVYTLTVLTDMEGEDAELTGTFTVVGPDVLTLFGDPDSAVVGEIVSFTGSGYSESQTVTVYAAPYTEGFTCSRPDASNPSVTSGATGSGLLLVDFEISDVDFNVAGVWAFCGMDGLGEMTPDPFLLTVGRTLLLAREYLVRYKDNVVRIVPPLPEGSVLEFVQLAGLDYPGISLRTNIVDETDFILVTTQSEGTYTLRVQVLDGELIEIAVKVVPQPDPPSISLSVESAGFGSELVFSGSGFLGGAVVTLMGRPGSLVVPVVDDLDAAGVEEEICSGMLAGSVFRDSDGVADSGGALEHGILVDISVFHQAGNWIFCAVDGDQNLTAEPIEVRLVPGMFIENGGRVKVGETVLISLMPAPGVDTVISGLKLGRRSQEFSYSDGVVSWTAVPDLMGDHVLHLMVGEEVISSLITILSGRRPDGLVLVGAMECPNMTEVLDGAVPGGRSVMSFTFRILETNVITCRLSQVSLPVSSLSPQASINRESSTTRLPDREIVLELNSEYVLPSSTGMQIHVTSYDNRFGYRYRPTGVRFIRSGDGDANHRIVLPSCTGWVDLQGNSAPCEIEHAKEIKLSFLSSAELPTDASADYATQIRYNDGAIWDIVNFVADIDVEEDRAAFNQSVTVVGLGYPEDELVKIYGVNTSRPDLYEIPEDEETDDWDCRLVVEYGKELGDVVAGSKNSFSAVFRVTDETFALPGKWLLCASAGVGLTSGEPAAVTIDYEAVAQTGGRYYAGDDAYIRIVPSPPEDRHATDLKIGTERVDVETEDDEVRFIVPVNVSGLTEAVVGFPSGLVAEVELHMVSPTLTIDVVETDKRVRIGSLVRLSADNLSGERVCDPELGGVEVAFLVDGRFSEDNCAVIGANRRFRSNIVIIAPDGSVPSDLVKLFDEKSSVKLVASAEDGAEVTADVALLKPSVRVTGEDGGQIRDNVLLQFQKLRVLGSGFPRDGVYYNSPQVGYEVRSYRTWDTNSDDGTWEDDFRITGRIDEGSKLEFVPMIAGHGMPSLAFILEVGIQTPTVSMEPSEVRTGLEVTITAENLRGFVGGYSFRIVSGDHSFIMTDYADGSAVFGLTDRDGTFMITFLFPHYEAEFYDEEGRTLLQVQMFNSSGEVVPEALFDVTHVLYTPSSQLAGGVAVAPTPTGVPIGVPTPTPAPLVVRVPTVTPVPTPFDGRMTSVALEEGLPRAVDHERITGVPSDDGHSITLDWVRPVGLYRASGYVVVRSENLVEEGVEIAEIEGMTSTGYVDNEVDPSGMYWYRVISYNARGRSAERDTELVLVMTPSVPGRVEGFGNDEPGSTLVSLRWEDPSVDLESYRPVLGYEVQMMSPSWEEWSAIARVGDYVRNWIVIDLLPGSVSQYRIAAYNGVGYGHWTEPLFVEQSPVMGEFEVLPAIVETPAPTFMAPVVVGGSGGGLFSGLPGGIWTVLGAGLAVLAALLFLSRRRFLGGSPAPVGGDEIRLGESGVLSDLGPMDLVDAGLAPDDDDGGGEDGDEGDEGFLLDSYDGDDPDELRRRLGEMLGVTDVRREIDFVPGRVLGDFDNLDDGPVDPDDVLPRRVGDGDGAADDDSARGFQLIEPSEPSESSEPSELSESSGPSEPSGPGA